MRREISSRVVEVHIHRDKVKCAIDLLEKGVSQREIAKTCGLSMTQASAIGREYGYYVDVKEYFEKLKEEKRYESWRKTVDEKGKGLEKELSKSVEDLRQVKKSLTRGIEMLIKALTRYIWRLCTT